MTYYTKYSVGQIVKITKLNETRRIVALQFTCVGTNVPTTNYWLDGHGDTRFVEHELEANVYRRINALDAFPV